MVKLEGKRCSGAMKVGGSWKRAAARWVSLNCGGWVCQRVRSHGNFAE
ncbi:MAG: hypothetical protein HC895_03285 [Leptolyngbyaceae cyanobacterium SM1_3_5]|nr:hypothetical protein [Leptolyngbyaceae cyanobacterium SM1_3_5]